MDRRGRTDCKDCSDRRAVSDRAYRSANTEKPKASLKISAYLPTASIFRKSALNCPENRGFALRDTR